MDPLIYDLLHLRSEYREELLRLKALSMVNLFLYKDVFVKMYTCDVLLLELHNRRKAHA